MRQGLPLICFPLLRPLRQRSQAQVSSCGIHCKLTQFTSCFSVSVGKHQDQGRVYLGSQWQRDESLVVWKVVGKCGRRHNSQSRKLGAQILNLKNRTERANQEQDSRTKPQVLKAQQSDILHPARLHLLNLPKHKQLGTKYSNACSNALGDSYSSNHYHCQFLLYHSFVCL